MRSTGFLIYFGPFRQRLVLGCRNLDCRLFGNAYSARHWAVRRGFVFLSRMDRGRVGDGASAPSPALPCQNIPNSNEPTSKGHS